MTLRTFSATGTCREADIAGARNETIPLGIKCAATQHREGLAKRQLPRAPPCQSPRLLPSHRAASARFPSPSARRTNPRWASSIACQPAHMNRRVSVPPRATPFVKLSTNPSPRTRVQRPQAPSSVGPSRHFLKWLHGVTPCLTAITACLISRRVVKSPTSFRHSSFRSKSPCLVDIFARVLVLEELDGFASYSPISRGPMRYLHRTYLIKASRHHPRLPAS